MFRLRYGVWLVLAVCTHLVYKTSQIERLFAGSAPVCSHVRAIFTRGHTQAPLNGILRVRSCIPKGKKVGVLQSAPPGRKRNVDLACFPSLNVCACISNSGDLRVRHLFDSAGFGFMELSTVTISSGPVVLNCFPRVAKSS